MELVSHDAKRFSGRSLKRGAVQLYRLVDLRDGMVMTIIRMKDTHAYASCCAWYITCSSEDIPKFASISEAMVHVEHVFKKKMIVYDYTLVESFLAETIANEIKEKEPM